MNHDQTTAKPTLHQYKVGGRVRILKPAGGVEDETKRFVGTLGTVRKVYANGDVFVEPDAAPEDANSWWYGLDEVELVESAPTAEPGWYVVNVWSDDEYRYIPARLVWAADETRAIASSGECPCSDEPHPTKAARIEIPKTPALGTRVSL